MILVKKGRNKATGSEKRKMGAGHSDEEEEQIDRERDSLIGYRAQTQTQAQVQLLAGTLLEREWLMVVWHGGGCCQRLAGW